MQVFLLLFVHATEHNQGIEKNSEIHSKINSEISNELNSLSRYFGLYSGIEDSEFYRQHTEQIDHKVNITEEDSSNKNSLVYKRLFDITDFSVESSDDLKEQLKKVNEMISYLYEAVGSKREIEKGSKSINEGINESNVQSKNQIKKRKWANPSNNKQIDLYTVFALYKTLRYNQQEFIRNLELLIFAVENKQKKEADASSLRSLLSLLYSATTTNFSLLQDLKTENPHVSRFCLDYLLKEKEQMTFFMQQWHLEKALLVNEWKELLSSEEPYTYKKRCINIMQLHSLILLNLRNTMVLVTTVFEIHFGIEMGDAHKTVFINHLKSLFLLQCITIEERD